MRVILSQETSQRHEAATIAEEEVRAEAEAETAAAETPIIWSDKSEIGPF